MPRPDSLSVAIIARDAEAHIARTISSVLSVADEIVLVMDPRTTDDTARIAQKAAGGKLRLYKRPWSHSFSAQRNAAIEVCKSTWVCTMDADEDMDADDADALRAALSDRGRTNLLECPIYVDGTYQPPETTDERFGGPCSIGYRQRIFRKNTRAHFTGRVHEALAFPCDIHVERVPVRFYHRGHSSDDKINYYMALMELDYQDDPADAAAAFYLAEYSIRGILHCAPDWPAPFVREVTRRNRACVFEAMDYLDGPDPEKIIAPHTRSKFFAACGKVCQSAWTVTRMGDGSDDKRLAREALVNFRIAIDINPDNVTNYLSFASFAIVAGEPGEVRDALRLLGAALVRWPTATSLLTLSGILAQHITPEAVDVDAIREAFDTYVETVRKQRCPETKKEKTPTIIIPTNPAILMPGQEDVFRIPGLIKKGA